MGPAGAASPSAARSERRSGRSHVKNFLLTIQARLPLDVDSSLVPGNPSAIRRTSLHEAAIAYGPAATGAASARGCVFARR